MRPVALLAILALATHAAGVTAQDKDAAPAVPAVSTAPVPTGAYQIDKAHTSLVFRVSHLGFSTYTGRFTGVDAKLQFNARNPAASQVNVDIDPRSIEADNAPSGFLQTLAGKDWLDAERFPVMTFRSRSIEPSAAENFACTETSPCTVSRGPSCSMRSTTADTPDIPMSRRHASVSRRRVPSSVRSSA